MTQTILILACSYKPGGRCVAGKILAKNQWIRVVGSEQGAALSLDQTGYRNSFGSYRAKPLLRISMVLGRYVPLSHQPENYIATPGWVQASGYGVKANQVHQYADFPASLWGESDRVPDSEISSGKFIVDQSLYLIKVDKLSLYRNGDKKRVCFVYNNISYDLPGTDPNYESFERGDLIANSYLCISLGEDFKGDHFKIVATIFGEPRQ